MTATSGRLHEFVYFIMDWISWSAVDGALAGGGAVVAEGRAIASCSAMLQCRARR